MDQLFGPVVVAQSCLVHLLLPTHQRPRRLPTTNLLRFRIHCSQLAHRHAELAAELPAFSPHVADLPEPRHLLPTRHIASAYMDISQLQRRNRYLLDCDTDTDAFQGRHASIQEDVANCIV